MNFDTKLISDFEKELKELIKQFKQNQNTFKFSNLKSQNKNKEKKSFKIVLVLEIQQTPL